MAPQDSGDDVPYGQKELVHMKILIISDRASPLIYDYFDQNRHIFEDVELVLSAGDLTAKYLEYVVTMIPAPLLYVPGNHDQRYEERPPEGCVCVDGRIVTVKGLRIAGLGGSPSANPDGVYKLTEQQMAKRVKWLSGHSKNAIDIFLTHSPAFGLGDDGHSGHPGFECFVDALDQINPRFHIFGHVHPEYLGGREYENPGCYGESVLYNAAVPRFYKIVEV